MSAEHKTLEELDRRLAEKWISGIWRIPAGARPGDPKTRVEPHLWKWADIYNGLVEARDQINIERGTAERRTLRLVNPGVKEIEMTSHAMLVVPLWHWHKHANRSADAEAILFSMNDGPVLK